MKTIAFYSSKGGSGKSTGSLSLSVALAVMYQKKTWLISSDEQNTVKKIRDEDIEDVEQLKKSEDPLDKEKAKRQSKVLELLEIENYMTDVFIDENIMPDRETLAKEEGLEYLIIDTIGTLEATTINMVKQCDLVLVPVKLSRPDLVEFFGDVSSTIRTNFIDDPEWNGEVRWYPSEYDKRTSEYREFFSNIEAYEKTAGFKCLLPGLVGRQDLKRITTVDIPEENENLNKVVKEFVDSVIEVLK